ncbi:MAG TPA: hypothetical protein ENL20_02860 [Candidatus Cloacimonetes bacterium]|nr:hypothetical protein [Candidatus Cloacimonadota bacterium]
MEYAVRNTIVLTFLLLLVIGGSYWGNRKSKIILDKANATYNDLRETVDGLKRANPDLVNEEMIISALERMEARARENVKILLKDDNPTITYKYLVDIIDRYCPGVIFNFFVEKSGQQDLINYNSYKIDGSSSFSDFYKLIDHLENESPLLTIESISLKEKFDAVSDTIQFHLSFKSYFDANGIPYEEVSMKNLKHLSFRYNPFKTRIHGPLQYSDLDDAIILEKAVLIGLTPEKIFMRDHYGKLRILFPGDEIAFGNLTSINWDEQCATFTINKTGVNEKKIIYIDKD